MNPRQLTIVALGATLLSLLAAQTAEAQRMTRRELELVVGEQTSISAEGVQSYSEGVPGIVDVRVPADGRQFVVVALTAGATTLLLIHDDGTQVQYRITVRSTDETPDGIVAKDNIRLDLYFMQLAENYGHQIGIGWPSSIGGGGGFRVQATFDLTNFSFTNATAVVTNQPLPRIDLLESSGWARIQRQAAVITSNGSQATFSSGEEVNIIAAGGIGAEVETIAFGSTVQVRPRYDRETGRIELEISAEVSDLTDGRGTGIPGRIVSKVDTRVNLEMGQAIVLGGLISDSSNAGSTGLPGLSQIPIIGILFGTHSEHREYTQNAVFIVPTVVDVVSQQARQRIDQAMEVYWDYRGGLDDLQLLPTPGGVPSTAHPDAPRSSPGAAAPQTPAPDGH